MYHNHDVLCIIIFFNIHLNDYKTFYYIEYINAHLFKNIK